MHPPQNTRSVPRRPESSSEIPGVRNLPRFIPLPAVSLRTHPSPSALAVLVALISRAPYAWDRLLSGSRLLVNASVDALSAATRVSPNTLRQAIAELERLDLVRRRGRRSAGSAWEITPTAFGLPEDDLERRRLSANVRRSYVALPVALVGLLSPRDLVVAIAVIETAGVGVLSRAVAGERIWVSVNESEIAASTGLSGRTVHRSLEALDSASLIAGSSSRGGEWAIELMPQLFGLENRTELSIQPSESDKSAFSAPMHPYTEKEEGTERRGVRSRAAAIALTLQALAVESGVRVTSSRWRARVRQAALQLAVAGATDGEADALAVAIARERGRPAPPEAVLDRYFTDCHGRSLTALRESQFACTMQSSPSVPQSPPPELASRFDDLELRVWRWRTEIEAGDPAENSFRDLLGGLPWESGYVALRERDLADSHEADCSRAELLRHGVISDNRANPSSSERH